MLLGMYISMIGTVHSGAKDELGKRRKKQKQGSRRLQKASKESKGRKSMGG